MLTYCPYTDRDLPYEQTSSEHIIPLALGGANGLELRVDAKINAKLGNELDGQLANDFFIAMHRTKYDTRGHSGKEPWATIKNASYGVDDRPAQVHFHRKHGIRLWDVRDRKEKSGIGSFRINTTLNIDLPVRFVAKVGLAAGYYAYPDLFRDHVDHHQLRRVMMIDPAKLESTDRAVEANANRVIARVDNYLYAPPSEKDWKRLVLWQFCSRVEGSVVVLLPGPDCLHVTVGVLGQFIGTVSVPANTRCFPNEGDYHWGHVMLVTNKRLERKSWLKCMKDFVGNNI